MYDAAAGAEEVAAASSRKDMSVNTVSAYVVAAVGDSAVAAEVVASASAVEYVPDAGGTAEPPRASRPVDLRH